jgi:predicted DNA-binding ribbon-helix-helix protein
MTLRHLFAGGNQSAMGSLKKRSVNLAGHSTSLALEQEFWSVLETAAQDDALSLAALIQRIDSSRGERPLASACRVFALQKASSSHPGRRDTGSGTG